MGNVTPQQGECDSLSFVFKALLWSPLLELLKDRLCQEKVIRDLNQANVNSAERRQRLSRKKVRNCVPIRPVGLLATAASGSQCSWGKERASKGPASQRPAAAGSGGPGSLLGWRPETLGLLLLAATAARSLLWSPDLLTWSSQGSIPKAPCGWQRFEKGKKTVCVCTRVHGCVYGGVTKNLFQQKIFLLSSQYQYKI